MAYLEVAEGPVPIQIELDRALLQTGSVYYLRTSGHALVRMVLVMPSGQLVEESVPFAGAPPPAPVPPANEYAVATAYWEAHDLEPEPAASRETAPAEQRQSRPATRAPRRLNLPVRPPVPAVLSQLEPPALLAQPGVELQAPDWPATRPTPVPDRSVPAMGHMIWTGKLERRGVIEIQGGQTSVGHLSGGLPGAPAVIEVFPGELVDTGLRLYAAKPEFANRRERPGPQNGWNATDYVWDPARSSDIRVLEPPDRQNGWKHLVMRAENRSYAVIVVRWLARPQ